MLLLSAYQYALIEAALRHGMRKLGTDSPQGKLLARALFKLQVEYLLWQIARKYEQ